MIHFVLCIHVNMWDSWKDKYMYKRFIISVEKIQENIMYLDKAYTRYITWMFQEVPLCWSRQERSTLNQIFRWPEVYRNATYGRLIVLVTRLLVRNDYFRHMHILESKVTLLELFVSTDQRMRCARFSNAPVLAVIFVNASAFLHSGASTQLIAKDWYRCQDFRVSRFVFRSVSIICIAEKSAATWALFNSISFTRSFNFVSQIDKRPRSTNFPKKSLKSSG